MNKKRELPRLITSRLGNNMRSDIYLYLYRVHQDLAVALMSLHSNQELLNELWCQYIDILIMLGGLSTSPTILYKITRMKILINMSKRE